MNTRIKFSSSKNNLVGFSLIECLIVLLIAAILLKIAVPSFERSRLSAQKKAALSQLSLALSYAKLQAAIWKQRTKKAVSKR